MTLTAFTTAHCPDMTTAGVVYRLLRLDWQGKLPNGCHVEQLRTLTGWEITPDQAQIIAPLVLAFEAKPYGERKGIGKRGKKKTRLTEAETPEGTK